MRDREALCFTKSCGLAALGVFVFCSASAAQEISAPLVRGAQAAKPSSAIGTSALMAAQPFKRWQEGDPVRVKQDIKGSEIGVPAPGLQKKEDPVLDRGANRLAPAVVPTIRANFDGIGATGVLPPDTIGAVGPNHFVQMVNSAFAIYDKSGNLLAGPSQINSLWKDFGGPCETDNDGDPVVRYDHLADRWLISQFAIDKSMQCIAISQGADPLDNRWHLYAFETKDAAGNSVTPDYPKIGVWPDGYYMSTQRGFPAGGLDVWVFERDKMLAGQPARQVQFAVGSPSIFFQPSDLDGPSPPAGTPNLFVRQMDGERFGGQDRVEIFAFSVNWSDPGQSSFKRIASLSTASFDTVLCQPTLLGACVPQPGTNSRLETLSVWPMFKAQYRNFGSHEMLLFNHTVDARGTDLAGIRWYEIRRPPGGNWTIFQQATHSVDTLHRWMGSIAMDATGNIAVGYSVADAQTHPGIRVAVRRKSDPKGTLGSEVSVVNGGGSQTNLSSRWGDYGSMDPDPSRACTFWFTTLYYKSTSDAGWDTRVAEIQVPGCSQQ